MQMIKTTVYSNDEAEGKYHSLDHELTLFAEVQAKNNGEENKPKNEAEFKALFLNKIVTKIQVAMDENQRLHLPVSGVVVSQKNEAVANEKIKPLASGLQDMEFEHRRLEAQKKTHAPDLRKRRIRLLVYVGAAIIAIAEGLFAYEALRHAPLAKLPAFITAVGITVALGFGTHIIAGYLKKATTRLQFFIRFCLTVIPVFIGFYVLGHLRAYGYNQAAQMNLDVHQNAIAQSGVSAVAITILSFLLFLTALLFSLRYYKTTEEEQQEVLYDQACRELKQCEKKMTGIRTAIENTKTTAALESAGALHRYEYALTIENRLRALGKKIIQEYIIKNLRYRTDGITPAFFAEPPELHFRLFFDNVKKDRS